jgi:hypothetical protein
MKGFAPALCGLKYGRNALSERAKPSFSQCMKALSASRTIEERLKAQGTRRKGRKKKRGIGESEKRRS